MFARVSTYAGSPDQVDESLRVGREQTVPAVRQIEGCKGVLYLVDRGTGKAMSITLWETEEAMRASEEAANQLRGKSAQSAGGTVMSVDRFEVAIDETF